MERELLLEKLTEIIKPVQQLSNIRGEYRNYHTPFIDVTRFHIIIKLILGYLLFTIVSIPVALLSFGNMVIFVILGIISIFITIYLYITLEEKINLFQINKKTSKHLNRIQSIVNEEAEIMKYLEEQDMPLAYCYPNAIKNFETYLKNQRADNLKECINLLEQDIQHQQNINELRTIQQIQEMTYQEAKSSKNIALLNLLTRR